MCAVQQHGASLSYAHPDLQNDKEVVMAAIKFDKSAVKFASPALQKDEDVIKVIKGTDFVEEIDYTSFLNLD